MNVIKIFSRVKRAFQEMILYPRIYTCIHNDGSTLFVIVLT